jgi:hypothetical protein
MAQANDVTVLLLQILEGLKAHQKGLNETRAEVQGLRAAGMFDNEAGLRFRAAFDNSLGESTAASEGMLRWIDEALQRLRNSQHS